MRLSTNKTGNTQQHNERPKDSYANQDVISERTPLNVHFKAPSDGYQEMFAQMEADGIISTRAIKADPIRYGELIFDVNTAYFDNHGGYDFAKQFYTDAYKSAIKIGDGEQYSRVVNRCHSVSRRLEKVSAENTALREEIGDYERVKRALGAETIHDTVQREWEQRKMRRDIER